MESANDSPGNDKKIIFKCDKHDALISNKLKHFYEQNEFFDTVLIIGTNSINIKVHRVVLCALSDYFFQIFRQSVSNAVELKDIEASTMKLIIDFMYSGTIALSSGTVEGILKTAKFLKIKTLIDGCCDVIEKNINFSNSLKIFRLAKELSLPKLKAKALEITYTHFERLSQKKELLLFSESELIDLLFDGNPHGDIEEYVFLSMVSWINYDKPNREHLVFRLLSMVRFKALTPKFIVENRKSVCKTIESYELICSWLQWHLSPETRSKDQQNYDFKPRNTPEELVVIKVTNGHTISIEAHKTKTNIWDCRLKTILPKRMINCSAIVFDGKLILIGGGGVCNYTTNVISFDINKKLEWVDFPEICKIQHSLQLVGLKEYLCVLGMGINDNRYSLELYNFSTCKWNSLQLPQRPTMSQIAACNGVLYILSFEDGLLQSYDVASKKWEVQPVRRNSLKDFSFSAVEGFLYVIGGSCAGQKSQRVQRYNLLNHSWSDMALLPRPLANIKTTLFNNKIIICDSTYVVEYNLGTNTWTSLCPLTKEGSCGFLNICNFYLPVNQYN